jgi:hypothetical protein
MSELMPKMVPAEDFTSESISDRTQLTPLENYMRVDEIQDVCRHQYSNSTTYWATKVLVAHQPMISLRNELE